VGEHTDEAEDTDRPPAEPPARDASPNPPHVDTDLPCYKCGYNLRTLSREGRCPECGLAVLRSTAEHVAQRWPLNAQKPCDVMSIGLYAMILLGMGIIPWAIGLVMLMRRMPRHLYWTPLKHATWLSLMGTIGCIGLMLFAYPTASRTFGIDAVIAAFALSLFTHYICVFLIAIGITTQADMPIARGIAASCLCAQLFFVALVSLGQRNLFSVAMALIMCGLPWIVVGTFFWLHVVKSLYESQQALIQKTLGVRTKPGPTQTV